MPERIQHKRPPHPAFERRAANNQALGEIEAGSFGRGGGRGKGGQDRGGGAGRKARQKVAPVDLHAPALSCPASARRVNHVRRLLPSFKGKNGYSVRFAHFLFLMGGDADDRAR
jgi:hypothetical protein